MRLIRPVQLNLWGKKSNKMPVLFKVFIVGGLLPSDGEEESGM
jgi:hypothetical protein